MRPPDGLPPPAPAHREILPILLGVLIAGWTALVLLPVIEAGFVNWDDGGMFLDNPYHRGSWEARLRGAWARSRLGEYMPVTWMSYGLDRSLWDLDPLGYHLTSLALHVVAAVVVYGVALRILGEALGPDTGGSATSLSLGAAAAALTFAIHPLRVEAVAWVSARGTVLGGLLLALSVLAYLTGWDRGRRAGRVATPWLLTSMLLFALSLLSRATGLVLPVALLVLDVYPLRRLGWRTGRGPRDAWLGPATRPVWAEKAGFAVLGALAVPMGYLARGNQPDTFWRGGYDPLMAAVWGLYSGGFYLWKTLAIGTLSPLYPMPRRGDLMPGAVVLSGAVLLGVTVLLVALRRRWPGALAAWLVYLILVGPMSGLAPFGRLRSAADRYTYVACLGFAMLAGAGVTAAWRAWRQGRLAPARIAVVAVGAVAIVSGWSYASRLQTAWWINSEMLWTRARDVVPGSAAVRNNLGNAFFARGDYARALVEFQAAERVLRGHPGVLTNVGRALRGDAQLEEAERIFRRVILLVPDWAEVRVDRAEVLLRLGRLDEAEAELAAALRVDPGSPRAHHHQAELLGRRARHAESMALYRRARELHLERMVRGGPPLPPVVIPAGDD